MKKKIAHYLDLGGIICSRGGGVKSAFVSIASPPPPLTAASESFVTCTMYLGDSKSWWNQNTMLSWFHFMMVFLWLGSCTNKRALLWRSTPQRVRVHMYSCIHQLFMHTCTSSTVCVHRIMPNSTLHTFTAILCFTVHILAMNLYTMHNVYVLYGINGVNSNS